MVHLVHDARVRFGAAVALGAVFAVLAFQYHWFDSLDLKVYDLGLSVRPALEGEPEVVVVSLDKYSRQNAFPPPEFPVSAHVDEHAAVIERLNRAGARVIAMDILFDELDPGIDVTGLSRVLGETDNVCLAAALEKRNIAMRAGGIPIAEERLVLPTGRIPADHYYAGLVNMPVDRDLAVRRSSCGRMFQGRWHPSMPAALTAAYLGEEARADEPDRTFYIDYKIPEGGLPMIPYIDVLKGEGWQSRVAGRVVVIGVTENSLSDVYEMPIRGIPGTEHGNKLAGALILAYATQTMIRASFVEHLARYYNLLIAIGLCLVVAPIALKRRFILNTGFIVVVLLGVVASGTAASALRLAILPSGLAVSAILVTAVAGLSVSYLHTRLKSQVQEEELEEISADLRKAAEIQHRLQPEGMPDVEGVEISGFQIACKAIGGDYYDVIDLGAGRVGLLIADVCGKGISAALLMSNLQSNFRQLAPSAASPRELVCDLNKIACRVFSEGRFVTLLYAILDVPNRRFTYCSAGHMPPLLCSAGGGVTQLERGGIMIGPFPDFDWEEHCVDLERGDLVFMYTDGLSEATDLRTEEMFDERLIEEYLRENCGKSPHDIIQGIVQAARSFSRSERLEDDITLLSAKLV